MDTREPAAEQRAPTATRQIDEPVVLAVSLNRSKAEKTIVDIDVISPLLWGNDEQQLAAFHAIRGAGL